MSKRLKGGAKGLKIQNIKNLVLDEKFVIEKNSKFIFFNKSIPLGISNVTLDGAETIIAKSQTNGFIQKSY